MNTDIQQKFEKFHKKELAARRISILVAIIPFVIGSVWMYFSYRKVEELDKKYAYIQQKSKDAKANYDALRYKKQQLESELMQNYGLPADSISNTPGKDIVLNTSIEANNAIKKLAAGYTPDKNIKVSYYYKNNEGDKIIFSLKSLGYDFQKAVTYGHMANETTNCIWYGINVPLRDCKIVALAMIRAGIDIKKIMPYTRSAINPAHKSNLIEIGVNQFISQNTPSYTVEQIKKSSSW